MGDVLVVAGAGFPVMLGRDGKGAEDGRDYRQEESKREEESVRTDQVEGLQRLVRTGAAMRRARLSPHTFYGMFGHSAGRGWSILIAAFEVPGGSA